MWSRVAKCNKKVKYSGQKGPHKILKTKHFTVQFKRGQNTHTKQHVSIFSLIFNQQKQVIRFTILVFLQRGIEWPRFRPRFFTANFRGGKFKQNRKKS